MKKILSIILLLSFALSLTAWGNSTEPKEISCEEIIKAYEDAGYFVTHGEHKTQAESSQLCYIKANLTEDSDSDYIYFITYFTEEQAEEAAETDKYNLAVWLDWKRRLFQVLHIYYIRYRGTGNQFCRIEHWIFCKGREL